MYTTVHSMINPTALGRFREPRPDEAPVERTWDDGPAPKEAPKAEFKFKKPEEVDEEAVAEKRKADAAKNKAKAKEEKNKEDEESFKHDEEDKAKKD